MSVTQANDIDIMQKEPNLATNLLLFQILMSEGRDHVVNKEQFKFILYLINVSNQIPSFIWSENIFNLIQYQQFQNWSIQINNILQKCRQNMKIIGHDLKQKRDVIYNTFSYGHHRDWRPSIFKMNTDQYYKFLYDYLTAISTYTSNMGICATSPKEVLDKELTVTEAKIDTDNNVSKVPPKMLETSRPLDNLEEANNIQKDKQQINNSNDLLKDIKGKEDDDQEAIAYISQLSDSMDSGDLDGRFEAYKGLTERIQDYFFNNPINVFKKIIQLFGEPMQGLDLREVRQILYLSQFILFQVYLRNKKKDPVPDATRTAWTELVKLVKNLIQRTENEQNGIEYLIDVNLGGIEIFKQGQSDTEDKAFSYAQSIFGAAVGIFVGDYSGVVSLGLKLATDVGGAIMDNITEHWYIEVMNVYITGHLAVRAKNLDEKMQKLKIVLKHLHDYEDSDWKITYAGLESLQQIIELPNSADSELSPLFELKLSAIYGIDGLFQDQEKETNQSSKILKEQSNDKKYGLTRFINYSKQREWRIKEKVAEIFALNCLPDIQTDVKIRQEIDKLHEEFTKQKQNEKVSKTVWNPNYVCYMKQQLVKEWKQKKTESEKQMENVESNVQEVKNAIVGGDIVSICRRIRTKQLADAHQYAETLKLYVTEKGHSNILKDAKKEVDVNRLIAKYLFDFHLSSKAQPTQIDDTAINPPITSLLITGDAGTGKSTLIQKLVSDILANQQFFIEYLNDDQKAVMQQQISQSKFDDLVVLYINMTSLKDAITNMMVEVLLQHNLIQIEIARLKTERKPILLLLDGYDEMNKMINIVETNRFDEWNCAVVTTCRSQYLQNNRNYRELFIPKSVNFLNEIVLISFNKEQISQYIKKFVDQHPFEDGMSAISCEHNLMQIKGVQKLIENPYILSMILSVFPHLQSKKVGETQSITRLELYNVFIQQWFERENRKLNLNVVMQVCSNLEDEFRDFSQSLATEMIQRKMLSAGYKSLKATAPDLALYFTDRNDEENKVRKAIPLKSTGNKLYSFVHKSICEYFAACEIRDSVSHIVKELKKNSKDEFKDNQSALNRFPIEDAGVFHFLIEISQSDEELRTLLLYLIKQSKHVETVSQAASNAITMLNFSNFNFGGLDLSGVKICGANLSGSFLDSVNFRKADLTDVILNEAWLRGARLDECNLKNVITGQLFSLIGHTNDISCVAFSPDCKYLASCSQDQKAFVWDVEIGKKALDLAKGYYFNSIAFSLSGKFIATAGKDSNVRLWDLEHEDTMYQMGNQQDDWHQKEVTCLQFFGDGFTLASSSLDGTVKIWNIEKHELIHTIEVSAFPVRCIYYFFDTKRQYIACGAQDGIIRIWDVTSLQQIEDNPLHTIDSGTSKEIEGLVVSPDAKTIAIIVSCSTYVLVLDLSSSNEKKTLKGHMKNVKCLAFSPNGKFLASGSEDLTVILWDIEKDKILETFEGHEKIINCLCFSQDGKILASAGNDQKIMLWEIEEGKIIKVQDGHLKGVTSIDFNTDPEFPMLASSSKDATVKLWDLRSGRLLHTLEGHKEGVSCICFNPSNDLIASASFDTTIQLWNPVKGVKIDGGLFIGHKKFIHALAFSPSGKLLASAGEDGIKIWDVSLKQFKYDLKPAEALGVVEMKVLCLSFSQKGNELLCGTADGQIHLWHVEKQIITSTFESKNGEVRGIAFSTSLQLPDDFIAVYSDGSVLKWSIKHASPIDTPVDTRICLNCVAFGRGGKIFATGGQNGEMILWDYQYMRQICQIKAHTRFINSVKFGPENIIASGSYDKTTLVYEYSPDKHMRPLRILDCLGAHELNLSHVTATNAHNVSVGMQLLLEQCGATVNVATEQLDTGQEYANMMAPSASMFSVEHSQSFGLKSHGLQREPSYNTSNFPISRELSVVDQIKSAFKELKFDEFRAEMQERMTKMEKKVLQSAQDVSEVKIMMRKQSGLGEGDADIGGEAENGEKKE